MQSSDSHCLRERFLKAIQENTAAMLELAESNRELADAIRADGSREETEDQEGGFTSLGQIDLSDIHQHL